MLLTTIISCRQDVGAFSLNLVGSMRGHNFTFSGLYLPSSFHNLEQGFRKLYEFLGGIITSKSLPGALIGIYNDEIVFTGEDAEQLSAHPEVFGDYLHISIYLKRGHINIGHILKGDSIKNEIIGYAESMRGIRADKQFNDDSIVLSSISYCRENNSIEKIYTGIVADGVTKLGKGYFASAEAIIEFTSSLIADVYKRDQITHDEIMNSFKKTSKKLREYISSSGERIATTFTGFIYPVDDTLEILSVGDTRAYMYRDKKLVCLTKDDKIPGTSILTKALGVDNDEPNIYGVELSSNTMIILVSDGIYSIVDERELLRTIELSRWNPYLIVKSILDLVNKRRGKDDASIGILVKRGVER